MPSKLLEAFEARAQRPVAPPNRSGSAVDVEFRADRGFTRTIDAIRAVRDCGFTLMNAKLLVEQLMATGTLRVRLPAVADLDTFIQQIEATGAKVRAMEPVAAK